MADRIRKLLSAPRAAWGASSTVTRVFLVAYALTIALHWLLRYAPGEELVELEPPVVIEEPVISLVVLPPSGERALLAMVGEDDWWLLDWTQTSRLDDELDLRRMVIGELACGHRPHQANAVGGRVDLLVWREREHVSLRFEGGRLHQEPAPPQAQWIGPDGRPVVPKAGKLGAHPPAWRVGNWAIMRPADRAWVQLKDGSHAQQDVAAKTGFLLYDARSGKQKRHIETTLAVKAVFPAPTWAGLLYTAGRDLSYIACDDAGCRRGDAELHTSYGQLDAAAYHPGANRIAICSESELFLYEGAPDDEYIVYLGKGALDGGCKNVWIASPTTVLLQMTEGSFQVARFNRSRG